MTHSEYYEEEYFEVESYAEADDRCTYERHWLNSAFYEDARFL